MCNGVRCGNDTTAVQREVHLLCAIIRQSYSRCPCHRLDAACQHRMRAKCVVLMLPQGLLQLGFVFMQFSTVVFALSIVQLMQAALR